MEDGMKTYSSIISLALFLAGTALLAGCGGGGGDSGAFFIPAPVAKAQPADTVIGQATFSSYSSLADPTYSRDIAAYTNDGSFGSPVVSTAGILYLPDTNANRVLGYNTVPTANGASADFVLGQSTFASYSTGSGANRMNYPQSVRTAASGQLLVTDYNNNRILVWNTAPNSTGVPADLVVGQPGFGSTTELPASSGLFYPEDMFVVGTKLIVADSGNNRILIWNNIPTASGIPADIVLGQNVLANIAANDDNQDGVADTVPSNRTLNYPSGIWSDGTRLIVCDSLNNRVLIWNTFPVDNFARADLVLGQKDFVLTASNDDNQDGLSDATPTARTFDFPYYVASNGSQLFIADVLNNRVLMWSAIPTTNFAAANRVFGQGSFTAYMENDDNQDGFTDGVPSARTMFYPSGVFINGTKLFVTDNTNCRFLIYTY
jgi:hypothetical protein